MPVNTADTNKVVDETTGTVIPAVMTFEQAHSTFKNFLTDNRERNKKNASIARKLNNEQPWNPRKLKAAGQSWRSNRPTGFMSSLMKRLTPPYKQMIDQLPLLTYSRFPDEKLGTEAQRDIFRKKVTDCIRQWSGWSDFQQQLIDEDIGYGYAAVTWDDDYGWKPSVYRGDEAFFYVGCPQSADKCKVWGRKKDYYVDEVVEILKDPAVAEAAGWRVKNLISRLNNAGKQFDDKGNEENTRVYEDLIRENNLSASFTSTVRVIKTGQLLALNPAGGIDHYIFDREDGTPLFFRRNRYAKMEQILALFSAEVGDQTLHGSKGAGRALYNTHVSVEQARNLIQDALHLSGLLLLKRTQKQGSGSTEAFPLSVMHPFAILGDGFDVVESVKFEINSEAFFSLDRHATSQAEVQVGAFMPGQIMDGSGEKRTASEVNYVASIDAQIRAGVLARYADQTFNLIDTIQQRICSPAVIKLAASIHKDMQANPDIEPIFDKSLFDDLTEAEVADGFIFVEIPGYIDQDALSCVLEMMKEGLDAKQIVLLSKSSSRVNVDDAIASQSGVLDMILAQYAMDPVIDTVELKRRHISSKLGAGAAERLMNVDMNPLSPIKQQRTQLSELTTMLNGNDTPTDPTDDDKLHLSVILDRISPMMQNPTISPLASSQQFLKRVAAHADAHIQSATQKGVKPAELTEFTQALDGLKKMLGIPPIDTQAQTAIAPVLSGQAIPAVQVAKDMPSAQSSPDQALMSVADPVRATPPRGTIQSAQPPTL